MLHHDFNELHDIFSQKYKNIMDSFIESLLKISLNLYQESNYWDNKGRFCMNMFKNEINTSNMAKAENKLNSKCIYLK